MTQRRRRLLRQLWQRSAAGCASVSRRFDGDGGSDEHAAADAERAVLVRGGP